MIDCPSCGGYWYMDIEPETGNPYTCFACGNSGVIKVPAEMHINDIYAEYAEIQNEQNAMEAFERENADLDAYMSQLFADHSADLDAVHYGKMQ